MAFPGERVRFFASARGALVADPESLAARLKERRLALQYVREYYLFFDLSRPHQEYLKGILRQHPPEVNTDLNPRCYFYDLGLSGLQEGLPLPEFLSALHRLPPVLPWLALALATILLGALLRGRTGPLCLYQVLIMGLGAMALEILGLILYQIHQGYLYRQMGLLIAGFMGGMAAGGALGNVLARRIERAPALLAALQGSMAALALLLTLLLPRISGSTFPGSWVLAGCALILAAGGAAAGGGFALSAALWVHSRAEAGAKGGALYAVDLLGATLGALGVSLVVLPVWGILPVLYLLAALHAGAAVMMVCGFRFSVLGNQ
jgi:spermidine synthase